MSCFDNHTTEPTELYLSVIYIYIYLTTPSFYSMLVKSPHLSSSTFPIALHHPAKVSALSGLSHFVLLSGNSLSLSLSLSLVALCRRCLVVLLLGNSVCRCKIRLCLEYPSHLVLKKCIEKEMLAPDNYIICL
jgi:hypothetical protein